jgi:hypothetical protein
MVRTSLAIVVAMGLAGSSANAADLATTDALPASLQAINANRGQIVTKAEAQKIRGEGGNKYGHSKRGGGNVNFAGVKNHHNAIIIDTGSGRSGGGGNVNFAGVKNHHNAIIIDTSGGGGVNFAGVKNHHNSFIFKTGR